MSHKCALLGDAVLSTKSLTGGRYVVFRIQSEYTGNELTLIGLAYSEQPGMGSSLLSPAVQLESSVVRNDQAKRMIDNKCDCFTYRANSSKTFLAIYPFPPHSFFIYISTNISIKPTLIQMQRSPQQISFKWSLLDPHLCRQPVFPTALWTVLLPLDNTSARNTHHLHQY